MDISNITACDDSASTSSDLSVTATINAIPNVTTQHGKIFEYEHWRILSNELTQMIAILVNPGTSYLHSLAAIYKLNKLVYSLEYQQILDISTFIVKNDTLLETLISMAMEGKPCVYQVIRFLSIVCLDPYGRKRLLKYDFLPILFALLKSNQYIIKLECFLALQTMVTTNDNEFLKEFGTLIGKSGIEMMISWMNNGSEEAVLVARRVLACVALTPKGRESLQVYQDQAKKAQAENLRHSSKVKQSQFNHKNNEMSKSSSHSAMQNPSVRANIRSGSFNNNHSGRATVSQLGHVRPSKSARISSINNISNLRAQSANATRRARMKYGTSH